MPEGFQKCAASGISFRKPHQKGLKLFHFVNPSSLFTSPPLSPFQPHCAWFPPSNRPWSVGKSSQADSLPVRDCPLRSVSHQGSRRGLCPAPCLQGTLAGLAAFRCMWVFMSSSISVIESGRLRSSVCVSFAKLYISRSWSVSSKLLNLLA